MYINIGVMFNHKWTAIFILEQADLRDRKGGIGRGGVQGFGEGGGARRNAPVEQPLKYVHKHDLDILFAVPPIV